MTNNLSRLGLSELPLWGVLDKLETNTIQPEPPFLSAKEVIDRLMPKIEEVQKKGGQLDLS